MRTDAGPADRGSRVEVVPVDEGRPTGEGPDSATEVHAGGQAMTPTARKLLQRRRRATLVAFLGLAIAVLAVGQFVRNDQGQSPVTTVVPAGSALLPAYPPGGAEPGGVGKPGGVGEPTAAGETGGVGEPTAATDGTPTGTASKESEPPTDAATSSLGRPPAASAFRYATGYGQVLGTSGPIRRFKVAVERTSAPGTGHTFADAVDHILGDPRSWIASRRFRLQQVPVSAKSEFTIYLVSARMSQRMCAAGGLTTDGYTSCRLPGQVIINEARWENAVPGYNASLATYRAYAVNHEVGHQLGYGHEACPAKGRLAPVMQQQTYGLKGCTANAWPYIDGRRYAGKPIA